MCKYAHAKEGYEFVLTVHGATVAHIRAKFEKDYPQAKVYAKRVPEVWVTSGYVEEVKISGEK